MSMVIPKTYAHGERDEQCPCPHAVYLPIRGRQTANKSADKRQLQVVVQVPKTVNLSDGKMSK